MYKLKSNKEEYITQTARKYFKYALEYVLNQYNEAKNGNIKEEFLNACTVNKISFIFDFDKLTVHIKSNQDNRFYKHSLVKAL